MSSSKGSGDLVTCIFFLLVSLSLKKEVLPKSLTTKPLTTWSIFNVIKALVMPSNTFLEIRKFMNYLLTLRKKKDVFWGEFVNDFVSAVRLSILTNKPWYVSIMSDSLGMSHFMIFFSSNLGNLGLWTWMFSLLLRGLIEEEKKIGTVG